MSTSIGSIDLPRRIEFWFEFASTYSYLSVMRLGAVARRKAVPVTWRPFLLGPIFADQGWTTSPFNIHEAKGDYMWRDMERRCARYGLPFRRLGRTGGAAFPQNGLLAARLALIGLDEGWGEDFCRRVFHAQFAEGADIADESTLRRIADGAGAPANALALADDRANRTRLRANVEEARSKGIFGAPSFVVGDELFWGDDRLEDALDWASTD